MTSVALIGEFDPKFEPHIATARAIEHSAALIGTEVNAQWISTQDIDENTCLSDGIWIAPGSPYKNLDKTLSIIRYARENLVPCFGTCGDFQHIILEYARNVLGYTDAQHAEYDPYASSLFVSQLSCSLAGREMKLEFLPDSVVGRIYGQPWASEAYYCNFGVNPDVVSILKSGPLKITGSDDEGEVRVIELPGHPFFIATLFVPQTKSTAKAPHPLVTTFLSAAKNKENQLTRSITSL